MLVASLCSLLWQYVPGTACAFALQRMPHHIHYSLPRYTNSPFLGPSTLSSGRAALGLPRTMVPMKLLDSHRATQPARPVLSELLKLWLEHGIVQAKVIDRPDPGNRHSREPTSFSPKHRSARLAEGVHHGEPALDRVVLSVMGQVGLAPGEGDVWIGDDKVGSEDRRGELVAVGAVADEGGDDFVKRLSDVTRPYISHEAEHRHRHRHRHRDVDRDGDRYGADGCRIYDMRYATCNRQYGAWNMRYKTWNLHLQTCTGQLRNSKSRWPPGRSTSHHCYSQQEGRILCVQFCTT